MMHLVSVHDALVLAVGLMLATPTGLLLSYRSYRRGFATGLGWSRTRLVQSGLFRAVKVLT